MPQPYQILFPIGVLYGFWGALLWILYSLGWGPYPGPSHAHLMVGGFLFSFALGFLMTAVPKFTGTRPANRWELSFATFLSLASFLGVFQSAVSLIVLSFLGAFFLSRFRQRTYSPPPHFIFIPLGLLLGIAGSILMMSESYVGRIFFFQGTMTCLVLGVGGKLVSALLGWVPLPTVQLSPLHASKKPLLPPMNVVVPLIFLLIGFALEFTPWLGVGRVLRAVAASWVALTAWKIHRRPRSAGRLAMWLRVSAWGLVAGLWVYALAPAMGVHALHLVFVCGFGLMTLMIASRVTLAHGGYSLDLEMKSKALPWVGGLIVLAAITRMIAPYSASYTNHLAYAAGTWILALTIWSAVFLPKIFFRAREGGSR